MNPHLQRMLCDAAWDGDARLIEALLNDPDVIPGAHHSTALVHAAHRGKTRCAELLLPVSDPQARNAEPLWRAARYRRAACVRLLAPLSDTTHWARWQWDELPSAMTALLVRLGKEVPGQ
ncbi:ankyrin repeat domain-containing protein [Luteibacter pinisoli]|nr:ankyrin repeat domain-containing protein [Luteibacter pinisoli]